MVRGGTSLRWSRVLRGVSTVGYGGLYDSRGGFPGGEKKKVFTNGGSGVEKKGQG